MTRDEFKTYSDELFTTISESLCQKIKEEAAPVFDRASHAPDKESALSLLATELPLILSNNSFQASCDYSEKLILFLFDNLSS